MAENFTIITDSSCDLPAKIAEQLHIRVIPLTVTVDGVQYHNFLDEREIAFEDFYNRLPEVKSVTTSAINIAEFSTVMESELMMGKDVLYLGFSSGLSATYNAAVQAAKELSEKLNALNSHAETDCRSEKLGYKIREAQLQKIPYMLVIGDRDMENGTVSVRTRKGEDLGAMTPDAFIAKCLMEIATKSKEV